MSLDDLPECEPLPAITTFESEGWTVHAATWNDNDGQALMSKGNTWAIGRWPPSLIETQESERAARNAFDRTAPPGIPRVSSGN